MIEKEIRFLKISLLKVKIKKINNGKIKNISFKYLLRLKKKIQNQPKKSYKNKT